MNSIEKFKMKTKKTKNHECNICSQKFNSPNLMTRHTNFFHKGQKPFKCESCGKSFSQAGQLKIHIHTVHERNKDYKCEETLQDCS